MVLLREEIGDVLRGARQRQGRTLRDVSSSARVSLGYLSEVERGQKEASSELLLSICEALDVPMRVPMVACDARDRPAVKGTLVALLHHLLTLQEMPVGPGGPAAWPGRAG